MINFTSTNVKLRKFLRFYLYLVGGFVVVDQPNLRVLP